MIGKLLTENHLEFLSLKAGFRGLSQSSHVKLLEISCRRSIVFLRLLVFEQTDRSLVYEDITTINTYSSFLFSNSVGF